MLVLCDASAPRVGGLAVVVGLGSLSFWILCSDKRKERTASFLSTTISKWIFPWMDRFSLVGVGPFYNANLLPTLQTTLESKYKTIQQEIRTKVIPELDHLYTLNRHVQPIQKQDDNSSCMMLDRKAFFFSIFGHDFDDSRRHCPETAAILDSIPGVRVAFVSILAPNTRITRHAGQWNKGLVRCHLGLQVPSTGKCCIQVGNQTNRWNEGEIVCFDETTPHEAWNDSDEYRIVLIVDVLRPLWFPMNILNWLYLELVVRTAKIRQGLQDIIQWEHRFHIEREARTGSM